MLWYTLDLNNWFIKSGTNRIISNNKIKSLPVI